MPGDAVWQLEKGPQPSQLAATVERNVVPALGTGDYSAHCDHQDIGQRVLDLAAARIRNRPEMSRQPLGGCGLLPHLKEKRLPPATQLIGHGLFMRRLCLQL